ncbi:PepSY domain-containing protein [Dyella jejuensis]|uniref:PepSY domain-containing protein n=1 Tax=Dyella jejuensis TaxID=1432009 RepID=A0ABW8JE82_9GAMM
MSASHAFLKIARQVHLFVGVFIAPALLFFAFTGGLQVFGLHEASRGSDYKPPAWLVTFAQLHKKQTTVVPVHKARPMEGDGRAATPAQGASPGAETLPARPLAAPMQARNPLPLKIFCAFVSFALFVSTVIGIYMAFRYTRRRVLISLLLLAGVAFPVILALM